MECDDKPELRAVHSSEPLWGNGQQHLVPYGPIWSTKWTHKQQAPSILNMAAQQGSDGVWCSAGSPLGEQPAALSQFLQRLQGRLQPAGKGAPVSSANPAGAPTGPIQIVLQVLFCFMTLPILTEGQLRLSSRCFQQLCKSCTRAHSHPPPHTHTSLSVDQSSDSLLPQCFFTTLCTFL